MYKKYQMFFVPNFIHFLICLLPVSSSSLHRKRLIILNNSEKEDSFVGSFYSSKKLALSVLKNDHDDRHVGRLVQKKHSSDDKISSEFGDTVEKSKFEPFGNQMSDRDNKSHQKYIFLEDYDLLGTLLNSYSMSARYDTPKPDSAGRFSKDDSTVPPITELSLQPSGINPTMSPTIKERDVAQSKTIKPTTLPTIDEFKNKTTPFTPSPSPPATEILESWPTVSIKPNPTFTPKSSGAPSNQVVPTAQSITQNSKYNTFLFCNNEGISNLNLKTSIELSIPYFYKVEIESGSSLAFLEYVEGKVNSFIKDNFCGNRRSLNISRRLKFLGLDSNGSSQILESPKCKPLFEGAKECHFIMTQMRILIQDEESVQFVLDRALKYVKDAMNEFDTFTDGTLDFLNIEYVGTAKPNTFDPDMEILQKDMTSDATVLSKTSKRTDVGIELVIVVTTLAFVSLFTAFLVRKYLNKTNSTTLPDTHSNQENEKLNIGIQPRKIPHHQSPITVAFVEGKALATGGSLPENISEIYEKMEFDY